MKVLITGAGLSGATAAALLHRAGHEVLVLDSREQIGGNCRDERRHGVNMHCYGPHAFHTNNEAVWRFLSRFTDWKAYEHRTLASTRLGLLPIPWSLESERVAGQKLSDLEIRDLIFVDYSEKQWGVQFAALPDAIRNRVPLRRDNHDTRYFTDRFQGQPAEGYSAMFARMLEGVPVRTGAGPEEWRQLRPHFDLHIYTGKVDAYFGCRHGRLPYRSLRFEHSRTSRRLCAATINQCNTLPYTREYDHAWFLGEEPEETVITREFPMAHEEGNEPFYPMPFGAGRAQYELYRRDAAAETGTVFTGRLATYCYLDMWMAVAQAMTKIRHLLPEAERQELEMHSLPDFQQHA